MAEDKVKQGLVEGEGEPPALPDVPGAPVDINGVADVARAADSRGEKVLGRIAKLTEQIDSLEAEIGDKYGKLTRLPQDQRKVAAEQEFGEQRRNILSGSEAERYQALRELQELSRRIEAVEPLFSSPQALLGSMGLGDPRRTELTRQLREAGPVAIRNAALRAVLTSDNVLGAAVMDVNDALPKRDRPVKSGDLASRLLGDQHKAIQASIQLTKNRLREGLAANRRLERGRRGGPSKIANALNRRQEAGANIKKKD